MALPVNVSLPEVLAAASARLVHLSGETAGYLVLALADELGARSIRLTAAAVALGEGGEFAVAGHEAASPDAVAAELRTLLASLLAHARPVPPSLRRIAEAPRLPGLAGLVRELEAALVPVNRAAAQRALSRLSRETARARGQVSTSAPEPLPPPTLSVEAIHSPAPPEGSPVPSASGVARRPPPLPALSLGPSTPGFSAPTPTPTPAPIIATAPKPPPAVSLESLRSPVLPADVAPPPAAVALSTPAAVAAPTPAPPPPATVVISTPAALVPPAPPTPAPLVATAAALAEVAATAPATPEHLAPVRVSTEKLARAASGEGTAGLVEAAAPSMPALGIAPVDVDALRRELRRLAGLDPA